MLIASPFIAFPLRPPQFPPSGPLGSVYVCVCVFVRETDRDTEGRGGKESEREKERIRKCAEDKTKTCWRSLSYLHNQDGEEMEISNEGLG